MCQTSSLTGTALSGLPTQPVSHSTRPLFSTKMALEPWFQLEEMGERERALMLIGKAIEYGYAVDEIQRDPELAALRLDPRFKLLLPDAGGEE